MKNDTAVARPIANQTGQKRLPYASPTITVYGGMSELTKANGEKPPTDAETTVMAPLSA